MEKTKVLFLVNLYPYEAGQIGEIKSSLVDEFVKQGYIEEVKEGQVEKKQIVKMENKSMENRKKANK